MVLRALYTWEYVWSLLLVVVVGVVVVVVVVVPDLFVTGSNTTRG